MNNLNSLYNSLYLLKPEIAIALALALVVTVDLIFIKNKKFLPWVTLLGLVVAGGFVIEQFYIQTPFEQMSARLLAVDSFGAFFKILIVFASILIVIFSITSDEIKATFERHGEYYSLLLGMVTGMFVMVGASDLLLVYLSLELVSLSSYVLAGFGKTSLKNSEASLKYLIYGSVSSGIMLFGISILFGLSQSTNLYEIKNYLMLQGSVNIPLIMSCIFIFAGIGYKISAAPFHFWTPDVYEGAPITITAYLSIASKAAGFALLIRFITITFVSDIAVSGTWTLISSIIDWKMFFTVLSVITMTLGNFAALWQNNMKRMLAYSSIAHAGYLLLGMAVLSNQGLTAIMIYFIVYAVMNLGAFLVVMLIANKIGSEDIEDYKGLGYSTPLLGISLAIFLVSLTGLPPTAGFIGKLYLFVALVDAKMITLAVIALINSVVSLYYYIRVLKHMFLTMPKKEEEIWKVSFSNKFLVLALAIPVIVFGIYFTPLVNFAKNSIELLYK